MHAVRQHLDLELRIQDIAAQRRPIRRAAELGKQQSHIEKAESLSSEMRVRAVVNGIEALDVPSVVPQRKEKATDASGCPRLRVARQRPDPAPGDRSECHLEGARPIDPNPVRVLVDPRFQQGEEALRGRLAVVEVVTLGEPDQMVMPAELPDALHIATADPVQVRDARPVQP
jgi:hypothetical protein